MKLGLEAAFTEANATNTLRGVYLSLISVDDGWEVDNISRVAYANPNRKSFFLALPPRTLNHTTDSWIV